MFSDKLKSMIATIAVASSPIFPQTEIDISGRIVTPAGAPISGIIASLDDAAISDTTNSLGEWNIKGAIASSTKRLSQNPSILFVTGDDIILMLTVPSPVRISIFTPDGKRAIGFNNSNLAEGYHKIGTVRDGAAHSTLIISGEIGRVRFSQKISRFIPVAINTSSKPVSARVLIATMNRQILFRKENKVVAVYTITDPIAKNTIATIDTSATYPWNISAKYDTIKDSRDGVTYKIITIGTQVWMAENLAYKTTSSYAFSGDTTKIASLGRLYSWSDALNLPRNCDTIKCISAIKAVNRGICPESWHIPSKAEWATFSDYLNSLSVQSADSIAPILKSSYGWQDADNGRDYLGWRAIPAGYRYLPEQYYGLGYSSYYWAAEHDSSSQCCANYAGITQGKNRFFAKYTASKTFGYSIRCIRD